MRSVRKAGRAAGTVCVFVGRTHPELALFFPGQIVGQQKEVKINHVVAPKKTTA